MILSIKNTIFKPKKTITGLIIAGILSVGGLEMITPQTSQADFMLDNYAYLTNTSIAQENTILPVSASTSPKIKKRVKMVITAYSSTVGQTDSTPFITASGSLVQDGIVANNLLPFGSKVRIPDLYGDKIFVVEDRMNSKKGNYHLDIWLPNYSEAKSFGSEVSYVEIFED